ncbi:hypothetical protein FOZ63_005259 [Perkinsus olseni]|uniref:F-box domain-containing protein n=2 Tax=Perkinsus olseni TaxID=32597 RepID=A0A7J6QQJ7_PEROL|nr:hypothetical protein FOZ63_005259 [Perkinsus olseni]
MRSAMSTLACLLLKVQALQRIGSSLSDNAPWGSGLKVFQASDGLVCQLESTGYVLAVNLDTTEVLVEVPGEDALRTEIAFPDDSPTEDDHDRCVDAINNLEGDIEDSDTIETVVRTTYAALVTTDLQTHEKPVTFTDLPDLALLTIFALSGQPLVCSLICKRALQICDASSGRLLWRGCPGGRVEYARRLRERRTAVASKLRRMTRKDLLPNLASQCDYLHLHKWTLHVREGEAARDAGPFKHTPIEWTFELSDPGPFVVSASGTVFRLTFSAQRSDRKPLTWGLVRDATFRLSARSAALLGVEADVCLAKVEALEEPVVGCDEVSLMSAGRVAVGLWSDEEVAVIYLNVPFYDIVRAFGLATRLPSYRLKGVPDELEPLAGLRGLTVMIALRDGPTVVFSNTFYRVDAEDCFTQQPEPAALFNVLRPHQSGRAFEFSIDGSLRLAWRTRAFRRCWHAVTVDVVVFNEEHEVLWSASEVAPLRLSASFVDDGTIDFDATEDWMHHYVPVVQPRMAALEAHALESGDGK